MQWWEVQLQATPAVVVAGPCLCPYSQHCGHHGEGGLHGQGGAVEDKGAAAAAQALPLLPAGQLQAVVAAYPCLYLCPQQRGQAEGGHLCPGVVDEAEGEGEGAAAAA